MPASTPTRRSPMMTVVATVALAMVLFLVNRAGEPPAAAPAAAPVVVAPPIAVSYAGTTDDGRVAVSVIVTGDRAEGHVAGRGGRQGVPLAAFLEGSAGGGTVVLGPRDGVRIDATVDGGRLRGTVWTGSGPGRPFVAVAEGGASR
ncbi:MAG: hypothetical protein AB7V44_32415 [Pseudonocardia sp.]